MPRKDLRKETETILKNSLVPVDISKLDSKKQKSYADSARSILESNAYQNETAMLIAIWTRHLAVAAEDFDEVRDMRMCINALELLTTRLREAAAAGRTPEPADDPFEAI